MNRVRVLVAEDHAAVAAQLRELLCRECDVIAIVKDGYALLGAASTLQPDVIVADIALPGVDGIAAAKKIIQDEPKAKIVLITVDDNPTLLEHGLEVGAIGYVMKLTAGDELLPAVHAAMRGEKFVSPSFRTPPESN